MVRSSSMMGVTSNIVNTSINSGINTNANTSTNTHIYGISNPVGPEHQGFLQTTPQISPRYSSGVMPRQYQQQGAGDATTSVDVCDRGTNLSLLLTTAGPPRRLTTSMAMTSKAASTSVATAVEEQTSATAQRHVFPLHDQPMFRVDLVRRSVFVFGLQTLEECRVLLQLLRGNCGPIAGAFRTSNSSAGTNAQLSPSVVASEANFSVVICVVFNRVESAVMARRLDNVAHVCQKRFVVESATRFQYLLQRHSTGTLTPSPSTSSTSSSSLSFFPFSGSTFAGVSSQPQHEVLWQLLFSPTMGAVGIDWKAAEAAVERGEALLLTYTPFPARGGDIMASATNRNDSYGTSNTTSGNIFSISGVFGSRSVTDTNSKIYGNVCHTNASVSSTTDITNCGEHGQKLDVGTKTSVSHATNATPTTTTTATSNASGVNMSQSSPTLPLFFPPFTNSQAGVVTDITGLPNTLQQQYYNRRYGSSVIPFFSSVARIASSLLNSVLGTTLPANAFLQATGNRNDDDDAHLPPPLRQRVELADCRRYDSAILSGQQAQQMMSLSPQQTSFSGEEERGRARIRTENKFRGGSLEFDTSDDVTEGAAYIPRVRSFGEYFIAALPFASHLLTPLFRVGSDDVLPHSEGHCFVVDGDSEMNGQRDGNNNNNNMYGVVGVGGGYDVNKRGNNNNNNTNILRSGNDRGDTVEELRAAGNAYEQPDIFLRRKRHRSANYVAPTASGRYCGGNDGRSFDGAGERLASVDNKNVLSRLKSHSFFSAHRNGGLPSMFPATSEGSKNIDDAKSATRSVVSLPQFTTTGRLSANISAASSNEELRAYIAEHVKLRRVS